eukprot:TRINITY_DN12838_c0_g1_i1.p1 TRINITY_DN12838_c0_g1~~TRINITY_DN12838_c0_g1_i1.p1  ORF type:complete len:429 (-),score=71.44 TRINITY_DN12838_c0_g1_i1:13-1299(-)
MLRILRRIPTVRSLCTASRDHREIGKTQQLFLQHPFSAGNVFFLPHGMRIRRRLMDFLRSEYVRRGYDEVETPQLFSQQLWETSGHWQHYRQDMFSVHAPSHAEPSCGGGTDSGPPEGELGLKPMNCPAHCLIYSSQLYSYRQLPVRLAEFGALHRNERTGSLGGMTRLRRFHQDDAHIFCTPAQLLSELTNCLDFVKYVYGIFDLPFKMRLSTRPAGFLGESVMWDKAELSLKQALDSLGIRYTTDEGGGAFYGPKIDIAVTDSLKREHQCATIQLDFQLPRKFDLHFTDHDGTHQPPVMIHRAILGSLERFIAVLTEHTGGRWPLWLSPRQVQVCTVADRHEPFARQITQDLHNAGFYVDLDATQERLPFKIRQSQLKQYNYIVVVGDREVENKQLAVRTRSDKQLVNMQTHELLLKLQSETAEFK